MCVLHILFQFALLPLVFQCQHLFCPLQRQEQNPLSFSHPGINLKETAYSTTIQRVIFTEKLDINFPRKKEI